MIAGTLVRNWPSLQNCRDATRACGLTFLIADSSTVENTSAPYDNEVWSLPIRLTHTPTRDRLCV